MLAILLATSVAAVSAVPLFSRPGRFQQRSHNGNNGNQHEFRARPAPINPYPANDADVHKWMNALGRVAQAPDGPYDSPGPSAFDDFRPPSKEHVQAAVARTLWFEEFPHRRAVLNWQDKRAAQGLPLYQLQSHRPGFPFFRDN